MLFGVFGLNDNDANSELTCSLLLAFLYKLPGQWTLLNYNFIYCIGWHHPHWNSEAAIYSTTLSSRFYHGIIINLNWHHRFIIQIRLVERRSCRRSDIFYRKVVNSWTRRNQCLKNTLTSWGRRRPRGFARRLPSKPSVLLCLSTLSSFFYTCAHRLTKNAPSKSKLPKKTLGDVSGFHQNATELYQEVEVRWLYIFTLS